MTKDYGQISPDARELVDEYLASVADAMRGSDPEIIGETLDGLRAHAVESLDSHSTREDAEMLVRSLGTPGEYAQTDGIAHRGVAAAGTVLGMPYDLRVPTAERVAARWWNPADPRIFVPKVFGLGWEINFGALAVHLHLIEPDAEDEPFARVPDRAFAYALFVPVILTVALGATYLWLLPELPARLPTHWGITGRPDDYSSREWTFGLLFAVAFMSTVFAVRAVIGRGSALHRGASVAFASFFSALSAGIWAMTLITVLSSFTSVWLPILAVGGCIVIPAAILVVLARIGRAAEIRSDLGR